MKILFKKLYYGVWLHIWKTFFMWLGCVNGRIYNEGGLQERLAIESTRLGHGGWVGGVGSILRIDGLIFYALEWEVILQSNKTFCLKRTCKLHFPSFIIMSMTQYVHFVVVHHIFTVIYKKKMLSFISRKKKETK